MGNSTAESPNVVLEFAKVLTWPIFVAVLLIVYRPPVGKMLASLESKLDKADSVKIGSFSLEVQARAQDLGDQELAKSIGELSFDAVEALMRAPAGEHQGLVEWNEKVTPHQYGLPGKTELNGLVELQNKGFVTADEPIGDFVRFMESHAEPVGGDISTSTHVWYGVRDAQVERRVQAEHYELTETGKKAVEAISKAVAAQLTGKDSEP